MTAGARHWAADLIGLPYAVDFRCWNLVRRVFSERHGINMPEHAAGVLTLKHAALVSGWRPVVGLAAVDDIVVMRNARNERHVGVFVEVNGRCGVLHNDGFIDADGEAHGCVGFDTLARLKESGCREFEFWRKQ